MRQAEQVLNDIKINRDQLPMSIPKNSITKSSNKSALKLLDSIEKFEGKLQQNIVEWIEKWQKLAAMCKLDDVEETALLLAKVGPDIQKALYNLRTLSVVSIFDYLQTRFACADFNNPVTELLTLKQKSGVTAAQLRVQVEAIATRAQHKGIALPEQTLVQAYFNAMQESYKTAFVPWPVSLQEAADRCTTYEMVHGMTLAKSKVDTSNATLINLVGLSDEVTKAQPRGGQLTGIPEGRRVTFEWTDLGHGYKKKLLTTRIGKKIPIYFKNGTEICGYCLQENHMFRDCGARAQNKPRSTCSKCNKFGHPAEICELLKGGSVSVVAEEEAVQQELDGVDDTVSMIGSWGTRNTQEASDDDCDLINVLTLYTKCHPVTVRMRVNGVYTKVIIDTGASCSVASTAFVSSIIPNYLSKLSPYTGRQVLAASGNFLKIAGYIEIPCLINKTTIITKVLVADNLPHCMLLGVDTLDMHDVSVHFNSKTVHFNKCKEMMPFSIYHLPSAAGELSEKTTIPGEHGTVVWLNASQETVGKNREWVIEPIDAQNSLLVFAYTVVQDNANLGKVPIQVLNLSEKEITLPAGKPIAKFFNLAETIEKPDTSNKPSVEEQIDNILKSTKIPEERQKQLGDLLRKFKTLFSEPTKLGQAKVPPHPIHTSTARPIATRQYRYSQPENEEIAQQVKSMLDKDVIQPSTSPWSAPVVLAKKKDGTWRFCIDYRALNNITLRDMYPLPRIDDALDALQGAKYFTTLDAWSGYWQIGLREEDKEKTAFSTRDGHYQFNVMPFGLVNAPGSFQRAMNLILHNLTWKTCLVYLDDIIVFSSTFEEHLTRLEEVFQRLMDANIRLKLPKCNFCQESVPYLGHVVSKWGVATDPAKVERMVNIKTPQNVEDIGTFLGMTGYYQRFIENYAELTIPLRQLQKKNTPFIWTPKCQEAFDKLKEMLSSAPILAYPDFSKRFRLQPDACQFSIGAVLSQVGDDNKEHPVAYFSRVLRKDERKYAFTPTELECLALLDGMRHFRPYLWGRQFDVFTDHRALQWLYNTKETNERLYRWFLKLACDGYDYNVYHRPGKDHGNADGISRLMCSWDPTEETVSMIDTLQTEQEEIYSTVIESSKEKKIKETNFVEKQKRCRVTSALRDFVQQGTLPKDPILKRTILSEGKNLIIEDDVLYHVSQPHLSPKDTARVQAVVPEELRTTVLKAVHDSPFGGGHFSHAKTYNKLLERWWWPNMYIDTKHWCASCTTCGVMRKASATAAPLQPIKVKDVWELIGIDIVGKLPTTQNGHKFILVITEYASRYAFAFPMKEITTQAVAEKILKYIVLIHGAPARILTDQGSNFNSALANDFYRLFNIVKHSTTAYHPQCDGLTERFNDTLIRTLAKLMQESPMDWDELIPFCLFSYNTAVQASTKFSPYYVIHGREPVFPIERVIAQPVSTNKPNPHSETYVQHVSEQIKNATLVASNNLKIAQDQQKAQYDTKKSHYLHPYRVGDKVWILNKIPPRPGQSSKFHPKWLGPFTILKQTSPVNYILSGDKKETSMHVARLKKYIEREEKYVKEEKWNEEKLSDEGENQEKTTKQNTNKDLEETTKEISDMKKVENDDDIPISAIPQDIPESIQEIITHVNNDSRSRYYVKWTSGEKSWVDEEDMNCPHLLVDFTKREQDKTKAPNEMLEALIEALNGVLKELTKPNSGLFPVTAKRHIRALIERGTFLQSNRVVTRLEQQLRQLMANDEFIKLLQEWITNPNDTFREEWDHL